jgi:membrane protein DedA with SNARE-associated domain
MSGLRFPGALSAFSGINSRMISNQHWLAEMGSAAYALIKGLGGPGVLILAIGDSSFLSVPEANDLLIVILSTGKSWSSMAYYVGMTIIGSVIGCLLLYSVGRKGGSPLLRRKFSSQSLDRAEKLFERYGILTVLVPSILPPPLPFKIFVLSAGVFRLRLPQFVMAVVIGRTVRYSMWGILAVLYGNSVKEYMEQNLDAVGIILMICFAAAVAAVVVFYVRRTKKKSTEQRIS